MLRVLVSYFGHERFQFDEKFPQDIPCDIFADSGAFSAYTQHVSITRDAYAAWIRQWQHRFTVYANLDVIGNAEKTWENQQYLEAQGLSPLPVFHVGEPFSALERLIERYAYIGIGGMVPHASKPKKLGAWLVKVFKYGAAHGTRFHGFGCTNWTILAGFPWASVDSSTWSSGVRFGVVFLWHEARRTMISCRVRSRSDVYKHAWLLRLHGYEPDEIYVSDMASYRADPLHKVRLLQCAVTAYRLAEASMASWYHAPFRIYLVEGLSGGTHIRRLMGVHGVST